MCKIASLNNRLLVILLPMLALAGRAFAFNGEGFVLNQGQIKDQTGEINQEVLAAFFSDEMDFLITRHGYSYQLHERGDLTGEIHYHRLDVIFDAASSSSKPEADQQLEVTDHLRSDSGEWLDIHYFRRILCRGIYPGVDIEYLILSAEDGSLQVKFNYLVDNPEDMQSIRLKYVGAESADIAEIDGHSSVVLGTSIMRLEESIPQSFAIKGNQQASLKIHYRKDENGFFFFESESKEEMKSADRLIIDPTPVILWSTYFGGSGIEWCNASATDGYGYVYLCGNTTSAAGIATSGAHQTAYGGSPFNDIFIAKFDSNGARIWSTYIGGTNDEQGLGIDIDAASNVYFCGSAVSSSGIATPGAYQTVIGGGSDMYFGKLSSAGVMQWATYLGGPQNDLARSVHVSGSDLYIAGQAVSASGVASSGAYQSTYGGGSSDGVIARFNTSGSIQWSSYYGGSGTDYCTSVCADASGNVFLAGTSNSSSSIATAGVHQSISGGSNDGFIVSFTASGLRQWASYLGGSGVEILNAIQVNSLGQIVIGGQTYSSSGIATAGAGDITLAGGNDGFINVFTSSGTRLYGSYVGGAGSDNIYTITLDAADNVYVGGNTASSSGLSTSGTHQATFGGGISDGMLAQLSPALQAQWISYFGGSGDDYIRGIALEVTGELYIAGFSTSSSGISTAGSYQSSLASVGSADAFLSQFNNLMLLLPVHIVSFTAEKADDNDIVYCRWEIAEESSTSFVSLERSADGVNWEKLHESASFSHDAMLSSNAFADDSPLSGTSYYLLRLMDANGNQIDSRELAMHLYPDSESLLLYPNPGNGEVNLSFFVDEEKVGICKIIELSGKYMQEERRIFNAGMNRVYLNLTHIPAGQYSILLMTEDGQSYQSNYIRK